ncbi:MAG: exo-alpha-sialidase [Cucumibacter sp.]
MRLIAAIIVLVISGMQAAAALSIPIAEVAHIHGIAFDPTQAGRVLLATHLGLYRTTGDGNAEIVSSDTSDYMGFTPHPTDAGLLYASGHPAGGGNLGFIVSRDGGVTWEQMSLGVGGPVDFHALTISLADPRTLYGLYGGIQSSRDGGETWIVAGPGPERVFDLAASAQRAEELYAGTATGLWVSFDAGKSWQRIGPEGIPVTMVEVAPDGSLYAYYVGNGLFRRSASEGSWSGLAGDQVAGAFLHLAVDPTDPQHLFAVTEAIPVIESRDGGINWAPLAD